MISTSIWRAYINLRLNLLRPYLQMEKRHGLRIGSLRHAVKYILLDGQNLRKVEKGCVDYCEKYPHINFETAFNLYASCLKHPRNQTKDRIGQRSKLEKIKHPLERCFKRPRIT